MTNRQAFVLKILRDTFTKLHKEQPQLEVTDILFALEACRHSFTEGLIQMNMPHLRPVEKRKPYA